MTTKTRAVCENCTDDSINRVIKIRKTVAELYFQAFPQQDDVPLSPTDIMVV
jgi:hypothetical protein